MTTISIDEQLIKEVIAVSDYQNAQEAVIKILAEYVQQHKKQRPPKRVAGILQGKLDDSFFEPLPQEELNAWQ